LALLLNNFVQAVRVLVSNVSKPQRRYQFRKELILGQR
jgi:hypothetical protein